MAITNNLIILGGVAIGLASLGVIFLAKIMSKDSEEEKDFKPKRIEEMIKPEIRDLGNFYANSMNVKLRFNYNTVGTVYKQMSFTGEIERSSDEDRISSEKLETAYEDDVIGESTYNKISEFSDEDINILFVRKSGSVAKVFFKVFDLLGRTEQVSKIMIVPERLLRRDEKFLSLAKRAEMTRFVGMDVAKEPSTFRFIENVVYRQLYEQSLEDQKNYHEKVNFYDSNFSQSIQELKAEANAEKMKYEGKGSSMVEED